MPPISFNMFLGRSSQRPHVGVFTGTSSPSFKPAAHFGVSLLFENINTSLQSNERHTRSNPTTIAATNMVDYTFAIVKPDALTPFKYQQINALIKLNEFEITRQKLVWLDKAQAEALFPERAAAQDRDEWLDYITCAPCLALELTKANAPLFWQLTMGAEDPNDVGGRDSDSIRGIIATDRIRNAVDGSQEPEDAVNQLRLVFSDSFPALPYDGFLMQRADEARCTLALIKPDVAQDSQAVATIIGRITARGYEIKDRVEITLSHAQASAFYAEHAGQPFFEGLVAFMSSGPTIALLLEGDDVVRGWRMMAGPTSPVTARQQMPQCIRALLGDDGPRNAVHGSDSADSAQRELGFFFHPRIQPEAEEEPPTPTETAVDSLSIADAGSEDKKRKKKKPKRRNKRKQAVTVDTDGPAPTSANDTGAHSDDSDDEHGPLSADSSAPITPAATHIRFDQLMSEPNVEEPNVEEPMVEEAMAVEALKEEALGDEAAVIVELAVAADVAHERTFALVKPDAYPQHRRQVVKHIVERGLTVVAQEEVQLTDALARQIYKDMADFPTFTRLVDFVTSGPALALVLEGANAVAVLRSLVGPTNPKTAKFEAPNSLRAMFGQDAQMNAIHASKDLREARLSIDAVFYGLLGGNFHVFQPSDDPLAALSEAIPTEAVAEAPEEQHLLFSSIQAATSTEESCLVSKMETLAVTEEASGAALEERGKEAEPEAGVSTGTPDQLAAPLAPPQTKPSAGEKTQPLGSRLASSPFLQADRQLCNDSPSATKKVGRIKSPFLGSGQEEAVFSPAPVADAGPEEPSLTNGSHEDAQPAAKLEGEPMEPLAPVEQVEPAAEEKEDAQLHAQLADLQLGSSSQAEEHRQPPKANGPTRKAPVTPQKNPPAQTAARPASTAVSRTVRRTPATGPATATPSAAATAARRTTLGPAPAKPSVATRRAPAPTTPSVTTRSTLAPATPSAHCIKRCQYYARTYYARTYCVCTFFYAHTCHASIN
ncbi:hypothetical protein GGI20_002589 [Coemansia sp. BCRC 34301]|nr:hypothetical protein GGI20_002589 [Coemansia sp. BCRC 34301]